MARVSVVVINLNGLRFLDDCFSSLQQQSFRDFETIFVDNGSTDGSVEYVRANWPNVKIIALEKNYGFGIANNRGIAQANGEYISLLNNDTKVDPLWLGELVNAMDQEPAVGMCASKILFADNPELVDSAGDDFFRFGASFSRHFYPASHPEVLAQRKCLFACAGACLYRKSMLREIGLFDEIYSPIYYEDSDLGFRAQIHGYDCLYVPTAIVLHRVSATTKRSSDTYIYVQMRNIEIFLLKNYPWGTYFLYLPMRLLVTLLVLLKYAMRGKGLLIVRAKLDFVRSIPGILRLRSEARRGRKVSEQTLASLLLPGWVRYKVRYFGKRVL